MQYDKRRFGQLKILYYKIAHINNNEENKQHVLTDELISTQKAKMDFWNHHSRFQCHMINVT